MTAALVGHDSRQYHGGGLAISAPRTPNGSKKISTSFKEALTEVRFCSRMEDLLLKKKSINAGDSLEIHSQKVDKLKVLAISLANSSSKAEKRISDHRRQKEEALNFRAKKENEVSAVEKELAAEICELEKQRDELEAQLKKGVCSTIDQVSGDKLEFVLIIAPLKESYKLARAMLRIADELKLSTKVCVIWPQGSVDAKVEGSRFELVSWTNYVDVEKIPRASATSWWEMCQITRKNIILVRPDEHIAWRIESDMVRDVDSKVRRVFSQILCLNRQPV